MLMEPHEKLIVQLLWSHPGDTACFSHCIYLFIFNSVTVCWPWTLLFRLSRTPRPIPAVSHYVLFVCLFVSFCFFGKPKRLKAQRNVGARQNCSNLLAFATFGFCVELDHFTGVHREQEPKSNLENYPAQLRNHLLSIRFQSSGS